MFRISLLLLPILLAGCVLTSRPRPGEPLSIPSAWQSLQENASPEEPTRWLRGLREPELEALVREALQNNRNLRATAARLRSASRDPIIARSALLPELRGSGGTSARNRRQGNRATGNDNASLRNDTRITPETDGERSTDRSYGVNLDLSWEIDLWGRLRNLDDAAIADFEATRADFEGARLSLAVNTGQAWFNVLAAEEQVALSRKTRESFTKNLRIIERNFKAGVPGVRALDVQFGRNNLASAERSLRRRIQEKEEAVRALEVLLGRYPEAALTTNRPIPALPTTPPAGIPATMLERRPDIARAKARLYAAASRADAARKNLLPALRLTGSTSRDSEMLSELFDPEFLVFNAAANLTQTLFRGGRLAAEARQALDSHEALFEEFAQTALEAFEDAESALAGERFLSEQEAFLLTEVEQATLAENQAERDYSEGLIRILEVLEAQRRAFNARQSLIDLRNRRWQNRLSLYLALGGPPF